MWRIGYSGFMIVEGVLLSVDGMGAIDFPFSRVWKLKVPLRVCNFMWMLAINRVPTKDFLISFDWNNVANFVEFFTLCWNMPLIGLQKSLWLVVIAASCWIVWLSQNGKVFERIKFNVAGVVMNEIAACGGVLRNDKGVVSALFSGRCAMEGGGGLEMAVLMTIKVAAEM
ncbi:hypothetical protein Goklo_004991, partial [Gossypium klotzschianum]|nr:hypothetical protein [Gossypium klotzschianum]